MREKNLVYLGKCIDILESGALDEFGIFDATQLAQAVENKSVPGLVIKYDNKKDIHYFYKGV